MRKNIFIWALLIGWGVNYPSCIRNVWAHEPTAAKEKIARLKERNRKLRKVCRSVMTLYCTNRYGIDGSDSLLDDEKKACHKIRTALCEK